MENGKMDAMLLAELTDAFQDIGSQFGFMNIVVKSNKDYTDIYLVDKHALQIEIDWREFNLFMYVVYLKDGKLPNKNIIYRYNDGHWCRKYLEEIYRTKRPKAPPPPHRHSSDYIRSVFRFYEQLISKNNGILRKFLSDID